MRAVVVAGLLLVYALAFVTDPWTGTIAGSCFVLGIFATLVIAGGKERVP